jgi:hypothetical protein
MWAQKQPPTTFNFGLALKKSTFLPKPPAVKKKKTKKSGAN